MQRLNVMILYIMLLHGGDSNAKPYRYSLYSLRYSEVSMYRWNEQRTGIRANQAFRLSAVWGEGGEEGKGKEDLW